MVYHYPHDQNLSDDQFLVGRDILVCPLMCPEIKEIEIYLPKNEIWYFPEENFVSKGGHVTLSVGLDSLPVLYRGGSIIPVIENPIKSSGFVKNCSITLYIFCDDRKNATGSLYTDDYETFDYLNGCYSFMRFNLEKFQISNDEMNTTGKFNSSIVLDSVKLFGFVSDVNFAKIEVENAIQINQIVKNKNFVQIRDLEIDLRKKFVIKLRK